MGFVYEKVVENDYTYQPTGWAGGTPDADQDFNHYILSAQYMFANGGVNGYLHYFANHAAPGVSNNWWTFQPAVLLNFGPVGLRGELQWSTGEIKAGGVDTDREGMGIYLDAGYTYGPGQIGAYYFWLQGDDPNTTEWKAPSAPATTSNPCCWFTISASSTPALSCPMPTCPGMMLPTTGSSACTGTTT
jgi:hypothetical protein